MLEIPIRAEFLGFLEILDPLMLKRKKNIKRKKSQSRYISRMRGGALIQPIAMEVCTSV
jgi:hypothetical protein